MLLESNMYAQKDHWNVISPMYSWMSNQCICEYMCDSWITGSYLSGRRNHREDNALLDSL